MAVTLNSNYQLVASKNTSTYSTLRLYAKLNSQNVGNNTSNITLQARLYGNGGAGSFSSGSIKTTTTENNSTTSLGNTSYKKSSETTLKTWTTNVSHSSDGNYTNKTITAVLTSTASPNGTASGTITIPQIKRASTLAKPSDFTFSTNSNLIHITYTEYVVSYTADLYMKINGSTFATRTNISSGSYVTFTSSELNAAYGLAPNTSTPTVTFELVTKNGSTQIGNSSTQTAIGTIPSSLLPSISSVNLSDYYGYKNTYGSYVQGKSKVNVSISATGSTGSSITSYSTTINGQTIQGQSFTTDYISTSGTNSYSVTVTDSRGRSTTTSGNYSVLAYTRPTINDFRITRCDSTGNETDEGSYIKLNVNATITSLNNVNTKNFKIEYKLYSASTWTTLQTYNSGYTYTLTNSIQSGFSSSNAYDLRLTATDSFEQQIATYQLPTAKAVMDFYRDGTGVAIGKVAQTSNLFEVGYDAKINGNLQTTGTLSVGTTARNTTDTWMPVFNNGLLDYAPRKFFSSKTHTDYNNDQDNLVTMSVLSWWDGAYNGGHNSNLTYGHQGELQCKPVELFGNASGTKVTISNLGDSVSNYRFLIIIYGWEGASFGLTSEIVDVGLNKTINLSTTVFNNSKVYWSTSRWTASGTTLNLDGGEWWSLGTSGSGYREQQNTIAIFKVYGIK